MNKKILILSSDTMHHRYFINELLANGIPIEACIFETKQLTAPFKTGPFYEEEEGKFEKNQFFKNAPEEVNDLEVFKVSTVNSNEAVKCIQNISPDFGIVFGAGKILPRVINLFRDGLINVHRGIAEKYRGLDSDLWAIYHGDYGNLGVTVHYVEPQLDTGEIVGQQSLFLRRGMKIFHIKYYTTVSAVEIVVHAANNFLSNTINSVKQRRKGRYYSFMPLELKRIIADKFHKYCEKLDE